MDFLVHTVKLKPIIKDHIPGKLVTSGISDVATASVHSEKTWANIYNIYIRECGSTLYVGFVRAVSPTNTNFRLAFLLTRLQEALYEDLAV